MALPSGAPGLRARPIPRVEAPSFTEFRREYEKPRRPVVITGALEGRAALESWSLESLARRVDAPVQVRVSPRGAPQLFDGNPGAAFQFRTTSLAAAVNRLREPGDEVWYVQHCDLRGLPHLSPEIGPLAYAPPKYRSEAKLWVAGAGTINPLHWDTHHAALAQVCGVKRFFVFPPEDSDKLASFEHRTVWRTTALDLSRVDRQRFPSLDAASAWTCSVRPGEVLFIPYAWWHYMECDEPTVSVTWWWPPSLAVHVRDGARERAATWAKRALRGRLPPAVRYGSRG